MKQYNEKEYELITHSEREEFDRLIKKEVQRNRRNGIVFDVVKYIIIASLVIAFIIFTINDIFID